MQIDQHGAAAASYVYADSALTPALTEARADGTSTEYYVDVSGMVSKIVHKDASGTEILAFDYVRDARQRVTKVTEYVNEIQNAFTTYDYGSGNLAAAELDPPATQPQHDKLYYDWIDDFDVAHLSASDPNRLVKEVRLGVGGYHHEKGKRGHHCPVENPNRRGLGVPIHGV